MDFTEKTKKSRTAFSGRIFDIKVDDIELPDGRDAEREILIHPGGVVILPITSDGEVILVRQYRYAVGRTLLELPAGKLEKGEDPKEAAVRELREETGNIANTIKEFGNIIPIAGYSSEIMHGYLCDDMTDAGIQDLDEDEFVEIVKMPLEEVAEKIVSGEIQDGKTVAFILKYMMANK